MRATPITDANALVVAICLLTCHAGATCDVCKLKLLRDAIEIFSQPSANLSCEDAVRKANKAQSHALDGINRKYDAREYYRDELPEGLRT